MITNLWDKYVRWCKKIEEDPDYEPAWLEPLEWMMLGALIMELILLPFV